MLQIACCKLQRTLFGQLKKIRSQTDRQTDRQTDGRTSSLLELLVAAKASKKKL